MPLRSRSSFMPARAAGATTGELLAIPSALPLRSRSSFMPARAAGATTGELLAIPSAFSAHFRTW
ncbi:MAG: hypothetical protein IKO67_07205, partial [Bacteroidaceae bacterium]|nr:hypothetical protein [Bacteroidaceae bacterium]